MTQEVLQEAVKSFVISHVNSVSDILEISYIPTPVICLLKDTSLKQIQLKMLFAGFTSAKKTIIKHWFTPDICIKTFWIQSLLRIGNHTTTRLSKARPGTVKA